MESIILVVEDDRDIAAVFTELLASEGYQVETLHNGLEALKFVQAHSVDLVVSDVRMPGMDGISLAASVRESGLTMPLILVSAVEPSSKIRKISNLVFLMKPVNLDTLLDAIAAALLEGITE
jgi:DNA-binding response OmpR family regulator